MYVEISLGVLGEDMSVDLSHLSEEERALIQNVMAKAKEIEEPPSSGHMWVELIDTFTTGVSFSIANLKSYMSFDIPVLV